MTAGTWAVAPPDHNNVLGKWRTVNWTYTGSSSYTSGGDTPPNLGIRSIRGMIFLGQNTASIGVTPVWNTQTGKLQLIQSGAEFSGSASGFTFLLMFVSNDD